MLGSWCSGACRRDGDWSQTSRHLKEKETEASRADMMDRLGGDTSILLLFLRPNSSLEHPLYAIVVRSAGDGVCTLHLSAMSSACLTCLLLTASTALDGLTHNVYKQTVFCYVYWKQHTIACCHSQTRFRFNCDNTDLQFCPLSSLFLSMLMNCCISCKLPHWIFQKRDIQINIFNITSNFSPKNNLLWCAKHNGLCAVWACLLFK